MLLNRKRVYLASRSPRRRDLLKQIGLEFELLLLREGPMREADVDETPYPGEAPSDYAERIARAKAEAGMRYLMQRRLPRMYPVYPLVAADTVVTIDGAIIGKPESNAHAAEILQLLSGRSHFVHTAVAVAFEDRLESALSTSEVTFRELSEEEIAAYIATGEPMDKAGAYGIQGLASIFVTELRGSYSGVVGLPLYETSMLLKRLGYGIL
ncbi:MAG: septum formation inhibitor Maf [Azospira oryzae]|uniref:dTTP/UTP pyrophosphatase n=1 Tax=Pelomicrobium methylotrophicum TaxID=2602750 RepID=A0A5C7EJK7_9PROT|nr:Maf family protein [Pelomicrobium methylotrophicum]PZP60909.1 MAG: septum formation inhibitor Maf [Azospira oryzae]PZP80825.1 MAG: septum formation inhibitor Maf [Azospira oryzae]TXF12652.1 septum formation inhibitor Maf [Pelomicrobium methylotrophicum]